MGRRAATSNGNRAAEGTGLTLDAGALIALERADVRTRAVVQRFVRLQRSICIPAGALAQAWRSSPRQYPLAILLNDDHVEIRALDLKQALDIGALLAESGTSDVVDAAVVVTARERQHWVVTSDAEDLRHLDPSLPLIEV